MYKALKRGKKKTDRNIWKKKKKLEKYSNVLHVICVVGFVG